MFSSYSFFKNETIFVNLSTYLSLSIESPFLYKKCQISLTKKINAFVLKHSLTIAQCYKHVVRKSETLTAAIPLRNEIAFSVEMRENHKEICCML